jgi:predicted ATPase
MMWSRGFASDESKTAFASALGAGVDNESERFDAYYGLLLGSLLRGELGLAAETAESFLRDAKNERRMTEAVVACRCVGLARPYQGDFIGAETNLAKALRTYDPERDRDAKFRFADETAYAPTRAIVYQMISVYQVLRGDPEAVRRTAQALVDLGREHGMALFLAFGEVRLNWARARLGGRETEVSELRRSLAAYVDQGNRLYAPLFQGRLAEIEAEGDDADGSLTRINGALALANETREHWTDALLHRIRGAIVLKREPANTAAAEKALQIAIAIAQAQKARSFELQAALSLARVYQSTDRPTKARAVLAPAIEGFAPTPEMPEIAEARAFLGRLAQSDEGAIHPKGGATEG